MKSQDAEIIPNFDQRLLSIFEKEKQYMIKGPVKLEPHLQSTVCSLFLKISTEMNDRSIDDLKVKYSDKNPRLGNQE